MKHPDDTKTPDMLDPVKPGRGRPKTTGSTSAQRMAARRARLAGEGMVQISITVPASLKIALDEFIKCKDLNKDQVIASLIEKQLLRKR